MASELVDSFPKDDTPNKQQEKILKNLDQAFTEGYRFVVISAPTGSGKSHIAKTLGNSADEPSKEFVNLIRSHLAFKQDKMGSYRFEEECKNEPSFGALVLTITKNLQDQYVNLFNDIQFMKGKSNYICNIDSEFTCDMAPCLLVKSIKEDCLAKNICPYFNARSRALSSKMSALNYKMFFSLPDHVKRREYIICDEAAELEDELVKHFTCDINFRVLTKLGINVAPLPLNDYSKYYRWVEGLSTSLYERSEELKSQTGLSKIQQTKNKKWIRVLQTYHASAKALIETFHDSDYQVEKHEDGVRFIPLKVNRLANYLFRCGRKIVLMSATIIDVENYCKSLGIDEYKYIEADSPFDPKKAPIYCSSKYKLNYRNIDNSIKGVIDQIEELCNKHKGQKGIIHTHSNKITQAVQNHFINNRRFLFREAGVSNEQILNIHNNTTEPTILVSPSMSHGVDLKGELAEFQILTKAPYLPLGDIRVKKMFEMDKRWYQNKMLATVIQACGRGIRSKSDHCETYILDGTIVEAIKQNRSKIPKFFLDRFY